MCCFSRHVEKVSATRIFARPLDRDGPDGRARQLLVYEMTVDVGEDVAMILPIPVPADSPADAVRFVDMSACPGFFDHVSAIFPDERVLPQGFGVSRGSPQSKTLAVHDVGDFEASFVPTPHDFDRLDARFRLPGEVWDSLPEYADWGFCVFKLKRPGGKGSGLFGLFRSAKVTRRRIHPMAFEFPRRDASSLFFPPVQVHAGVVHPTAEFDHELFCQTPADWEPLMDWSRSRAKAGHLAEPAQPWVEPQAWMYKRALSGELPNRDTFLVEGKLRARAHVDPWFRLRMRAAWEHVIDDGKTSLDARTKKWMRVGEAERIRIRMAVSADLADVLAEKAAEWRLAPFVHDLSYVTFFASNERIEPQELDVAFAVPPDEVVRAAVQACFQAAIDRATR
jgi:hypothetical protein